MNDELQGKLTEILQGNKEADALVFLSAMLKKKLGEYEYQIAKYQNGIEYIKKLCERDATTHLIRYWIEVEFGDPECAQKIYEKYFENGRTKEQDALASA